MDKFIKDSYEFRDKEQFKKEYKERLEAEKKRIEEEKRKKNKEKMANYLKRQKEPLKITSLMSENPIENGKIIPISDKIVPASKIIDEPYIGMGNKVTVTVEGSNECHWMIYTPESLPELKYFLKDPEFYIKYPESYVFQLMDNFPGMFYQRHLDFYDYAKTLYNLRAEYNIVPNIPQNYEFKMSLYQRAFNYASWLKQEMGILQQSQV
jgi:hypothetical protein